MIVVSEEGHALWLPDAGPDWTVGDATAQLDQAFPQRTNVITHAGRAIADAAQRICDVCALCGRGEDSGECLYPTRPKHASRTRHRC